VAGAPALLAAAVQFLVTVLDPSTGRPVPNVTPADLDAPAPIESVRPANLPADVLLLLDTSVPGGVLRRQAEAFLDQLGPADRMAVAGFHDRRPVALAPFTADKSVLARALRDAPYAGDPALWDSLAAALSQPFPNGPRQRVVLLLTAGIEGANQATPAAVADLARDRRAALFPVFLHGSGRYSFAPLARETGGVSFWLREHPDPAAIWAAIRSPWLVTLAGPAPAASIKAKGREKTIVSALPYESR
jgi:hypothetical protein